MLITMCWNKLMEVVLACYTDFKARVGLVSDRNRSTVYDVVKAWVTGKAGKFTSAEVIAACPSGSG